MKIKGFTIIEVLVASCIFLILVTGVFMMMDVGRGAWFTADVTAELRQDMIRSFMRMEREIKETRPSQISLSSGSSSPALSFKLPQDNDGNGTILDSLGRVEWSGNVTYALNGAKQLIRTAAGATTVIANDVVALQFTRPLTPVNILQVDMTVRKNTITGRIIQDSGQIFIKMRN